jgi:redox-sensitive bicupin YhaK (pirin superfamily)
MAAKNAQNGAATIHQDAKVFVSKLKPGESVEHALAKDRGAYVHIARGGVTVNGAALQHGDGAAIEQESVRIKNTGSEPAELLLFDLA